MDPSEAKTTNVNTGEESVEGMAAWMLLLLSFRCSPVPPMTRSISCIVTGEREYA